MDLKRFEQVSALFSQEYTNEATQDAEHQRAQGIKKLMELGVSELQASMFMGEMQEWVWSAADNAIEEGMRIACNEQVDA